MTTKTRLWIIHLKRLFVASSMATIGFVAPAAVSLKNWATSISIPFIGAGEYGMVRVLSRFLGKLKSQQTFIHAWRITAVRERVLDIRILLV